jgi:hypothetical protein
VKAQYTPGPWVTEPPSKQTCRACWTVWPTDGDHAFVTTITQGYRAEANTQLIAAAPELLEALENLLACVNVRIDDPRIGQFDAARAIVAKAKGEQ